MTQVGAERIFQEKVSGIKKDRPKLTAMLDDVRDGDTVIVTKLDRIAQSTKHLLEGSPCERQETIWVYETILRNAEDGGGKDENVHGVVNNQHEY